jgi:REP element-mobilizing transposase RayT
VKPDSREPQITPKAWHPTVQGAALGTGDDETRFKAQRAVTLAPKGPTAMPQSLANVLLHVIFSTKNRRPFLRAPHVRDVMAGYLAGTLKNLKCSSITLGVVEDHVHILCNLSRTITIAQLVEQVKKSSSARIKEEGPAWSDFHWQNGYGAFSVSQSNVAEVRRYIENQEERHRTHTFQEELRLFLKRHGLEFDERYVWD